MLRPRGQQLPTDRTPQLSVDLTGKKVHIEGSAKLETGSCQRLSVVPSETDQDQLFLALLITLPGQKRCLVTVAYRALYDALQLLEARYGSPHTRRSHAASRSHTGQRPRRHRQS